MASQLVVLTSGRYSRVRLQLEDTSVGGDNIGAWTQGDWAETSRTAFINGFSMEADGSPVGGIEIVAHSTDKADEPNAADLWPSIAEIEYGEDDTAGNYIEYWIRHEQIDRDAAVTWSITSGVVEQGLYSNFAVTDQAADEQRAILKATDGEMNPIVDNIDDDATVVFVDPDNGTLPKLPNMERGLGTPDQTYADLDVITDTDINGEADAFFIVDCELQSTSAGPLFEVGSSTSGICVHIDASYLRFTIKNSTGERTLSGSVNFAKAGNLPETPQRMLIGLYVDYSTSKADLYIDGLLVGSNSVSSNQSWGVTGGFSPSGEDGKVGGIDGTAPGSPLTRANITINSLKYWEAPTLDFQVDADSRDWNDMGRLNINSWGGVHSTMQAEIDQYKHTASDIADLTAPGSIEKVANARLAHQLIRGQDNLNANASLNGAKNAAIALKSGMTIDSHSQLVASTRLSLGYGYAIEPFAGNSETEPFVIFRWGGLTLIEIDMSSTDFNDMSCLSIGNNNEYFLIEDRIFNVTGLPTQASKKAGIRASGSELSRRFYVGGMKWVDWPGTGMLITSPGDASSDCSGLVFGEMCWASIGENNFRGACLSTGAHQGDGYIEDICFGVSYYKNKYTTTDAQTHKVGYWKGVTPYMIIEGGWAGFGPGIILKNDFNRSLVVENLISWGQRVGIDFGNNGISIASEGYPATNRDKWNGPQASRVVWQGVVISDCEDYGIAQNCNSDSEARDFILFSKTAQDLIYYNNESGQSGSAGEEGGDPHNFGLYAFTAVCNAPAYFRPPQSDTRSDAQSIGNHDTYISRGLIIFTSSSGLINLGDDASNNLEDLETLGRVTGLRFRNCHIQYTGATNAVEDGPDSYTTLALAAAGVNGGDTFVDCASGEVVLYGSVSKSTSVDPLLAYFVDNGYADYDEVEAAIVAAWEDGWDKVPEELQVETIKDHFRDALTPTNLDASDYGGMLPGTQSSITPDEPTPVVGTYYEAALPNPDSALAGYSVPIDLSQMPSGFWSAVDTSDGTKGRVTDGDGNELPSDWINFDDTAETGLLRVKMSLLASGTQKIRVFPPLASRDSYTAGSAYGQHNAYDTLWAGYWPDGGEDRTMNGVDGTGSGGITLGGVSGQFGDATDFDGTDDYITTTLDGDYGEAGFTIMGWMNLDATGWQALISDDTDEFVLRPKNTNVMNWQSRTGGTRRTLESSTTITLSSWIHWAATRGQNGGRLFRDGALDVSDAHNTGASQSIGPILFGKKSTNRLNAQGQEFQYHLTQRSDDWVSYEHQLTSDNSGEIGSWSEGETAVSEQNIIVDQAPDDGTINLGNIAVGSVQTVHLNIRNNAPQPGQNLTLGGVSVSAGGTLTVDPSLAVIAAGSSQNAEVSVDTATPGARAITIQIPSDDPDNPVYTITVNASVLSVQDIAVDEAAHNGSIDLGSIALGAATSVDLTIRNAAQAPGTGLTLGVLSVGADGTITTNPSNQTIAAGASTAATISVDTTTAGARSIAVQIPSDDPDTPAYAITIDATVVGAELQVTLDETPVLDGGEIELNGLVESTHATITLDITNAGMADLTLGTIMTSGNLSITANGNPSGDVLASLDTVSLEILIDTSVVGPVSGSVSIPSNDADSPLEISASGVVAASANPSDDYTGPDTTQQFLNVAEADAIIALYLIGANTFRQAWQSLGADDKLVCIAHATIDFNAIPWDGRKVDLDQPNAFPRQDRYGNLMLPGGEVQYPPSLGGGAWSFPSLPREIRIGVALQAAARAADQLEIDQSMKITGMAAQGITGIGGAGTSWATDGMIARQPSSRLHESVRRLVQKYLRVTAEVV